MNPLLSTQPASRRWLGLLALTAAALLAHLLLFRGLDWAWPRQRSTLPASEVRLRVVDAVPEPARAAVAHEPTPVPVADAPLPARPARIVAMRPKPAAREPAVPVAAPTPDEAPVASALPVAGLMPVVAVAPAPAPAPEPVVGLDAVPHYRTQLPPPITLHYVMQKGALRGSGDFSWRPEGDHYELRLEGRVAGLSVLTQVSSGGFDADGVAPLRFTDQRLRRGTKAANFQRGAGKITFSGPGSEFPLHEGAQDRLSWMVQLGAVVAAEPKLRGVGAKVVLYVVGANGDASVWAFDCTAIESVTTGAGTVSALKFVREPREPYDTQVQVWIDPAQHYLPVRATQKSGAGDDGFELRLQSADSTT